MPMLFLQKKLRSPRIPFSVNSSWYSFTQHLCFWKYENITTYCRTDTFKHSFFLWTIVEWNKPDLKCHKCTYNYIFRNHLLKSIRPLWNPIFNIHDPLGTHLLTRLRPGLSHLNKHRFNHNFDNCIKPLCTYTLEIESTIHFFLHCHFYSNICKTHLP